MEYDDEDLEGGDDEEGGGEDWDEEEGGFWLDNLSSYQTS